MGQTHTATKNYMLSRFVKFNENFVNRYNRMMDDAINEAKTYGVNIYKGIDKSKFIEAVQLERGDICRLICL